MKRFSVSFLLGILGCLVGCSGSSTPPNEVIGAGSTFVNPLMIRWTSEYARAQEKRVTYHSLGSAGGIHWLTDKKADFGCTDGPMTDEQLQKAQKNGGPVLHIPLVMGAVVPAYNLQGVKQPLRFTGPVLADIFLGKIKKWSDPALVELNPDAALPDQPIVVVHRADGSGTTYIWVDYLAKVSPEWKQKVGVTQTIAWPTGVGKDGNEGVTEHIKKTPGTLGYIELAFAFQADLPFGLVQNREKEFIRANLESVTAAADGALAEIPDDLRYSLTNAPGKRSYPVSGTTWAVVYVNQPAGKGEKVVDFLRWITHEGQEYAPALLYAPLPRSLVERVDQKLAQIKVGK